MCGTCGSNGLPQSWESIEHPPSETSKVRLLLSDGTAVAGQWDGEFVPEVSIGDSAIVGWRHRL